MREQLLRAQTRLQEMQAEEKTKSMAIANLKATAAVGRVDALRIALGRRKKCWDAASRRISGLARRRRRSRLW